MLPEQIRYDMYIHWELARECNFACEYCYAHPVPGVPKEADIPRIINRLDRFNKTMLITFAGGEPFLLPNFIELVREVTKKHYVRIDTNLSLRKKCEEFTEAVDPERIVEITFSVHALEREARRIDLADLADLVKRFQERGFRMVGNYVAYPPVLERMERDVDFFKAQGITVLPALFVGKFAGRNYPVNRGLSAYCEKELELIEKMSPYAKTVMCTTKDEPCHAGSAAFFVNYKYEVFPCTMIHKKIGDFFGEWNAFPAVIKCPEDYCFCPFNRPLAASTNIFQQANMALLKRAISEKNTASPFISFMWTATPFLLLRKMGVSSADFLGLYKPIRTVKTWFVSKFARLKKGRR